MTAPTKFDFGEVRFIYLPDAISGSEKGFSHRVDADRWIGREIGVRSYILITTPQSYQWQLYEKTAYRWQFIYCFDTNNF